MIIVGIITGAVFKAQGLMESARLRTTWQQISELKLAIMNYKDQYGYLPGNDSNAAVRFGGNSVSGSGNGLITEGEQQHVWPHLAKAGSKVGNEEIGPLSAKIGGNLYVQSKTVEGRTSNWIVLAKTPDGQGALTPQQAAGLKQKAGEIDIKLGTVRFMDGKDEQGGACVKEGRLNLDTTTPACIALIDFS